MKKRWERRDGKGRKSSSEREIIEVRERGRGRRGSGKGVLTWKGKEEVEKEEMRK